MGWGSSTQRGGGPEFVPSLESLLSLGSERGNLECSGNFAGMSWTREGVFKNFVQESSCSFFVPIKLTFCLDGCFALQVFSRPSNKTLSKKAFVVMIFALQGSVCFA